MAKIAVPLSRTAIYMQGALMGHILPKLAMDSRAKFDLTPILGKVTRKNIHAKDGKLKTNALATIIKLARDAADPLLAPETKAAGIGPDDIIMHLLTNGAKAAEAEPAELDEADPAALAKLEGGDPAGGEGGETGEAGGSSAKIAAWLKAKGLDCSMDDIAELEGLMGGGEDDLEEELGGPSSEPSKEGEDETPEEKKMKFDKAMDGLLKKKGFVTQTAMDAAVEGVRIQMRETQEAREFVRPWVGEVAITFDSAESVFRTTLETLGVDGTDEIKDPAALKLVIQNFPKPGEKTRGGEQHIALDAAAEKSLADRFPAAARIGLSG